MTDKFFAGLDFGTSGVRISIINEKKFLIYTNSFFYKYSLTRPQSWIHACEQLLDNLPIQIKTNILKLAISGTSGTLTACDSKGKPIKEAIPYYAICDEQKELLDSIAKEEVHLKTPYSSLAKALKLIDKYGHDLLLRHQADMITGWFLKDWTYGEEGNNIKLGWDLIKESWPKSFSNTSLLKSLPLIIKSGEPIGEINKTLAKKFGLNSKIQIISGTTDSNAGFLAAELNQNEGLTVLGTTIVLKKFIHQPVKEKGITIHRISGNWICGGSSNAGCGVLSKFFSNSDIENLSRQINTAKITPFNLLPLNSYGERFPINNPKLAPILSPRPVSDSLYLQALFEGLARIELRGWQKLQKITGSFPERIITIGGGARNPQWRSIRQKMLNIPIVSSNKTSSYGAALLAINSDDL
tara:strand:+ start:285 stop:1520 length:1236 start_codon:yes stop_codon:yes gene_type:complete